MVECNVSRWVVVLSAESLCEPVLASQAFSGWLRHHCDGLLYWLWELNSELSPVMAPPAVSALRKGTGPAFHFRFGHFRRINGEGGGRFGTHSCNEPSAHQQI
jgi:hypothetical protein